MMHWTLNGAYLADFQGLPQLSIDRLEFVALIAGVHVFTCPDLPAGTMELWDGAERVAVIQSPETLTRWFVPQTQNSQSV